MSVFSIGSKARECISKLKVDAGCCSAVSSLLAQLQDLLCITACFFACHITCSIYCTVCIQSFGSRRTGELMQNRFCKIKVEIKEQKA